MRRARDEHVSRSKTPPEGGGPKPFWIGASVLVATLALTLWLWHAYDQFIPAAAGPSLRILGTNLGIAIAVGLVVWLVGRFVVRRFAPRFPSGYCGVLAGALTGLVTLSSGVSRVAWLAVIVVVIGCATVIGGVLYSMLRGHRGGGPRLVALGVAVAVLVGGAVWLAVPTGSPPAPLADVGDAPEQVADLSQPGDHEVSSLRYGSGKDRRSDYSDVAFTTPTVDLSEAVTSWSSDRLTQWGFDPKSFPLNGVAWYPKGDGPFPLVLMVHGNKTGVEDSEKGYAYLGEQLASRGIVAVSIDENFLNSSLLDSAGGGAPSTFSRALILLEHLRVFNEQADLGPLSGKVDAGKVALLGHSRGGEAVTIAAYLNSHDGTAGVPEGLVYGFSLTSVIAVAPSDDWHPEGTEPHTGIPLEVSYLALQGSQDADVVSLPVGRQYEVTQPGPGGVKALLYIGGADHSQFSTVWGRRDIGNGATKLFLDTGRLIEPGQQRTIASGYVTAFTMTTLLGDDQRALLEDYRAGSDWLPRTRYISRYASGDAVVVSDADGEESIDASMETPVAMPPDGVLSIDAAAASGTAARPVTVTVTDAAGASASAEILPGAPPPLDTAATKLPFMQSWGQVDPVPQTLRVPASELAGIDTGSIVRVVVTAQDDVLLGPVSLSP